MDIIPIIDQDGEAYLVPNFISPLESAQMFNTLLDELAWERESITIYGRQVAVPRLVAWYGEPDAIYRYSGVTHTPQPWTPMLKDLRTRLEQFTHRPFNSVLANLYRDGNDSMGWHADKEQELGDEPYIASLSLGEERLFRLRHNKSKKSINLTLGSGSLFVMGGALQHHWRHTLPKTMQLKGPRINLTFRMIYGSSPQEHG